MARKKKDKKSRNERMHNVSSQKVRKAVLDSEGNVKYYIILNPEVILNEFECSG